MSHEVMTAGSILSLFDTTKEQRQTFVESAVRDLLAGTRNPLELHYQVKCMEEIVKQLTSHPDYKAALLQEAAKYGEKSFNYGNAKFEIKEAGAKWDYSQTGDAVLENLQAKATALAEEIKDRQRMLQNIPESGMADPETGGVIYRAAKSSTTTVAVTLK